MINAEQAAKIETALAQLIDAPEDAVRDYLRGNVRAGNARRTGYRFVRGTHGATYVRDPEGVDSPPYPVPA